MFLEIKPHAGVYITYSERISTPTAYEEVKLLTRQRYINLSLVQNIFPDKVGKLDNPSDGSKENAQTWSFLEQAHSFKFEGINFGLTLIFTNEGMGEYNRIKRAILDEKS